MSAKLQLSISGFELASQCNWPTYVNFFVDIWQWRNRHQRYLAIPHRVATDSSMDEDIHSKRSLMSRSYCCLTSVPSACAPIHGESHFDRMPPFGCYVIVIFMSRLDSNAWQMHHRIISLTEFFLFSVWLRCSYTLQAPPPSPSFHNSNVHVRDANVWSNICCDRNAIRAMHKNSKTIRRRGWGRGMANEWKKYCMRYPQFHSQPTATTEQNEYYDYMRFPFGIAHYRWLRCAMCMRGDMPVSCKCVCAPLMFMVVYFSVMGE